MSLFGRLSLHFAALLVACCGGTAWLQMLHVARQQQQVDQRLLQRLAEHVAGEARGLDAGPLDQARLTAAAERLAATNPAVDLYLLDGEGRVTMRQRSLMPLLQPQVDLGPLHAFLMGGALPLFGDDPAARGARKVFSVAMVTRADAAPGYLYAVLQGSNFDAAIRESGARTAVHLAAWSAALVAPLGALAAMGVFRWVTRPLERLTREVQQLERASRRPGDPEDDGHPPPRHEIAQLRQAFDRLATASAMRWERLARQDEQRRALVANISHDLRTPLASLHGYLETLMLRADTVSPEERDHYLRLALSQSLRVNRLAGELLELARLELGATRPTIEPFALDELAQDVLHKLALAAEARGLRIECVAAPALPAVQADIGMIERVLTNLLDNAMRHSPEGGTVRLRLAPLDDRVQVALDDQGPGLPPEVLRRLSDPDAPLPPAADGGGLGLSIVRQILRLHGSELQARLPPAGGTEFTFTLARV